MTQAPYGYVPQDPYAQPNPYAQPPAQYAPQGYAPAPQYAPPTPQGYGYAPQQFQPQQAPVQPQGARGTLDDYMHQPTVGSGKGISWTQKPDGYTYVGVVTRTPVDGDLFQDSDPKSGALKTFRDGSPKFVLPVQLRIAHLDQFQQMTYPDHDARVFLRGGLRDEINRAMAEAGDSGVPKQGALMIITLTNRKPGNNIATNVYAVQYHPAGTWEQQFSQFTFLLSDPSQNAPAPQQFGGAPQQAMAAPTQQAPYQQQAPAQYAAPAAQAYPNPQQYAAPSGMPQAAPQYGQPAYDPNPQQAPQYGGPVPGFQGQPDSSGQFPAQAQPAQQADPNQFTQAAPAPQAPMNPPVQPPQQPQAPVQPGVQQSGLDPAKQALLNRLGAQQQPQG